MSIPPAAPSVRLSPPQYGLQRRLSFTVGAAGGVSVSPVTEVPGGNQITISAWSAQVAEGLVNTLRLDYNFGGIRVKIVVRDADGRVHVASANPAPGQLEGWLRAAFVGNPLVYGVSRVDAERVGLVCMPAVVQFWNDDISTPTSYTVDTAANTFAAVVRQLGVLVYTVAPTLGNP